jgi:hypothetical protein
MASCIAAPVPREKKKVVTFAPEESNRSTWPETGQPEVFWMSMKAA